MPRWERITWIGLRLSEARALKAGLGNWLLKTRLTKREAKGARRAAFRLLWTLHNLGKDVPERLRTSQNVSKSNTEGGHGGRKGGKARPDRHEPAEPVPTLTRIRNEDSDSNSRTAGGQRKSSTGANGENRDGNGRSRGGGRAGDGSGVRTLEFAGESENEADGGREGET